MRMFVAALIASSVSVGHPPQTEHAKVLRAIEGARKTTLRINPSLTSGILQGCWRVRRHKWECVIRYRAGLASQDMLYTVGRELTRRWRNGHWVGHWHPSGRMSIGGVEPYEPARAARSKAA